MDFLLDSMEHHGGGSDTVLSRWSKKELLTLNPTPSKKYPTGVKGK